MLKLVTSANSITNKTAEKMPKTPKTDPIKEINLKIQHFFYISIALYVILMITTIRTLKNLLNKSCEKGELEAKEKNLEITQNFMEDKITEVQEQLKTIEETKNKIQSNNKNTLQAVIRKMEDYDRMTIEKIQEINKTAEEIKKEHNMLKSIIEGVENIKKMASKEPEHTAQAITLSRKNTSNATNADFEENREKIRKNIHSD